MPKIQPSQTAIYPGSFDPVTQGHIEIAQRAQADFDHLIVAVGRNANKVPMFTTAERIAMLREALPKNDRIEVASFEGSVAAYARRRNAKTLVRGLRNWRDWLNETTMMVVNFCLGWGLRTKMYQASPNMLGISSSKARQRAAEGADVTAYVPKCVEQRLQARARQVAVNPPATAAAPAPMLPSPAPAPASWCRGRAPSRCRPLSTAHPQ